MSKKRMKVFLLVLLSVLIQLTSLPYTTYAEIQDSNETSNLIILQTTQDIALNTGITITEGTNVSGEIVGESFIVQVGDTTEQLSLDFFTSTDLSTDVYNYKDYEVEYKQINKNSLYSQNGDVNASLVFNEDVQYPVFKDENGKEAILLGNVKFYLGNDIHHVEVNTEDLSLDNNKEQSNLHSEKPTVDKEVEIVEEIKVEEVIEDKDTTKAKVTPTKKDTITKPSIQTFSMVKASQDPWANNSSKYFEVIVDNLVVYDNRGSGPLKPIGTLKKGQVYPRVSDYGNWHRIQFGDIYGYVKKEHTIPSNASKIHNLNKSYKNQSRKIKALKDIVVYDNSSGKLVPFGTINVGQVYPIASDYGNWWRIIYSDRVGYVRKSEVESQFLKTDKYFRADQNSIVYDNRGNGPLKPVGQLVKGQVYPRVSDYGNWHRIDFGDFYGYVRKSETSYATKDGIKNLNKSYKDQSRTFIALQDVTVYDNTSGSLVKFGTINKGTKFPYAFDYGKWWGIIYSDRVGYIQKTDVKVEVKSTDKYFRVYDNLPVYDNRTGSLVKVGELRAGQSYPIHSDYGNWWRVDFGNIYGYVKKSETGFATKNEIPNLNTSFKDSDDKFITNQDVIVYDNSGSGPLQPFGQIEKGTAYPIASEYGNWWRIIYLDRVGYVRKSEVSPYGITYSKYDITLEEAARKQMKASPQTDIYMNGDLYVRWDAFESLNGTKSGVLGTGWNIRTGPGTEYKVAYNTGNKEITVKLIEYARDSKGAKWWKISRDSLPQYLGYWVDAKYEEVLYNMDPNNFVNDELQKFQFLDLRYFTGIPVFELNSLLNGKGNLNGTGAIFREAAQRAGINELYLISHALLETGHGTSPLAKGVKVNGKTYYNFFGIGAYDNCALECGTQRAVEEGWDTIEKAIIGGAQFAKNNYIYSGQNTLYKMRWNPQALVNGNPTHQYATDVGWARKQVSYYTQFYLNSKYQLYFDIPVYK